jgi:hypothetical protein
MKDDVISLEDGYIRHDPEKLAKAILRVYI